MTALAGAPAGVIEHLLPLSECRLRVIDLIDGVRIGELYGPDGQRLDDAECVRDGHVSGWFGRTGALGRAWALAFGAGGTHERLDVRFASLRSRRTVPVVSDRNGLWVAEVVGAYRAATILGSRTVSTVRLRYAAS
jgi:hypothetical protein